MMEEYNVQEQQTPLCITQFSPTTSLDLVSMCSLHNFMNIKDDSPKGVEDPMGIKNSVHFKNPLAETTKTSCTSIASQYPGSVDAAEISGTSDTEEIADAVAKSEASDIEKAPKYFESADNTERSGYLKKASEAAHTDTVGIFVGYPESDDMMLKTLDMAEISDWSSDTTETPETTESTETSKYFQAFGSKMPVDVTLVSSAEMASNQLPVTDETLDVYDTADFRMSAKMLAPGYLEQTEESYLCSEAFLATLSATDEEDIASTSMPGPGKVNLDSQFESYYSNGYLTQ